MRPTSGLHLELKYFNLSKNSRGFDSAYIKYIGFAFTFAFERQPLTPTSAIVPLGLS